MLTAAKTSVHPFSYAPAIARIQPVGGYSRGMSGDHERCRHLVWRNLPEGIGIEPGPYCRNDLGVFPILDCPAFQGRTCARFELRDGDPEPAAEEELRELAARLSADYLGWRYWDRIRALAGEDVQAPAPAPSESPPAGDPDWEI